MAKLSAHGTIIGTVDYVTYQTRYMSDGAILRNQGAGWKLYRKVIPERTPAEALARTQAKLAAYLAEHTAKARYFALLKESTGFRNRGSLSYVVASMPDDPDGVWSECGLRYGLDSDAVETLCAAYRAIDAGSV